MRRLLLPIASASALLLGKPTAPIGGLGAQSPEWSSVLTIAPNPSPYLADWERVPSTALLSLTYTGTAARDFKVRVTLTSVERGQVGSTESPTVTLPGGATSILYSVRDAVFEWTTVSRNPTLADAARRTGQIPEGTYRACARVFVGAATVAATEACADFSILQPDPPQLLSPRDDDAVVSTQPFFQWTPVLVPPSQPVSYEITVVEVLGSQVPRSAIDANLPVLRAVTTTPFLMYPIDALPLERTRRYAWRIRAVDAAGQQLFRDGAQSEIWTFQMSDELLKPVGKIAELPDTVTLIPGLAQLTGLRGASVRRTETDVEISGTLQLEFLGATSGAASAKSQAVKANRLRAGFRGDALTLLDGRIEAAVPEGLLPADVRNLVSFAPLVFTPATGFTASASLKLPGRPVLPLGGTVQLTAGGLVGRLEGAGISGLPFARLGRAPVQFAATGARLTLPGGALEFSGKVFLFEQDVDCPTAGALEKGTVRLQVFCDPARGFRPDTTSPKSLVSFGTLSGSLAADFLTDTLGSDLRGPATFSVFGETNRSCALDFTIVFVRDAIRRENERASCASGSAVADFGWVSLGMSNLRIDRLEYAPGATLMWRARVDLEPNVRGAANLQLPVIRDVVLDAGGVQLPSTSSDAPGTSTSGYVELDGFGLLPRTMGFRGGTISYARWLRGTDPGLEWGSGTSWIRLPAIQDEVSSCINAMPLEVDTLVIKDGRIDAPLLDRVIEGGCRLRAAAKLHMRVKNVGGRVTFAMDTIVKATALPLVAGDLVNHLLDCGLPVIGCIDASDSELLTGEIHLTPYGRLIGRASGVSPEWVQFNLKFAKLKMVGGQLALGVDGNGDQTALYDGDVKVDFGKIEEQKKADSTAAKDTSAAAKAKGAVSGVSGTTGVTDPTAQGTTVTAPAKIDYIREKLLGGRFVLPGPFKMTLGFFPFIIGEAVLDTTGLSIDGRQKLLVKRTTVLRVAEAKTSGAAPDTTYSSETDTTGVTFARVGFDPASGEVSAGTITLDAGLALETNPVAIAGSVIGAGLGGLIAQQQGDSVARAMAAAPLFSFTLARATAPFNPGTSTNLLDIQGGNIRLSLPGTPTIDSRGLRLSGSASAEVNLFGQRFNAPSVSFENDFGIRPVAGTVSAGRALVKAREYPIAFVDQSGWHFALSELVQTVIPDTLFLADQWTAYVVLRNAQKQLLVQVNETPEGPRITTRPGTGVRIVVPALKGSRQSAPAADITMDITLEKGTWRPLAGEIKAGAAGSAAAVNDTAFNNPDFPFALDSLVFRATRGAAPSFFAHGRIDVWPGEFRPMRVSLGFSGAGELTASAEAAFNDSLPLVSGSQLVKFRLDTLRFNASGKLGSTFQWMLETPGRLAYYDAELRRETMLARGTFRLSPTEAALVNFQASNTLTTVRLPGVDLNLGRVRAPTFRWDFGARKFDFELMFDVGLMIPALDSLALPEIRDIRLTPLGLVIPAFEMASTPVNPEQGSPFVPVVRQLRVGGFSVKALAYRVGEFRWNWFANAPPPQLNFGVDLEFGIEDLPSAVEGQAARIALRALDVGMTNGRFTGRFERIDIPTPIRTPVAEIRGAFGSFELRDGQAPDIRIGVLADLRLPDVLACPDAATRKVSLDSPRDTLFLTSNGTLRGAIRDVIPRCPMALGPFDLQFGPSTVRFAFDAATSQANVDLDASVTLRVPSATPGQTVSATGRIVLDVDQARVADASIAIDQPFFFSPDSANPFLKLIVNQASLTQRELRFGAIGKLRTNEGAGVDVAFENVAFDLNTLALASGRIRLTTDAAVGIEIPDDGSLLFGVYPVSTPRGGTASARLVLPTGALIDSAGVHVSGTATASLGFGGETYAALAGEFANDFTIGFANRIAITRGRINLRDTGGQLIAYADSLGFWPGNVFAVLPIPARLGIPSVDVAYIQLRNPADTTQLLVETEFTGETVRVRTRPNQRVEIAIPALARFGPMPRAQAAFDLVLNSRTMRPVSGALQLDAAAGDVLFALEGLPIAITQLGFRAEPGGFRLRAGAKALLPGPLGDVDLTFRDLEITASGLTGQAELGQYSETFNPSANPIANARILGDTLSLTFTGARLTLDSANTVVQISGGIQSAMFASPNGVPRVINLAATVDRAGFRATADLSNAESPIPIGVAALRLQGAQGQPALLVQATATEFAIVIGGSLSLPTIAPGFSIGVEGMKIGSAGVSIPNVSITAPANTREFELFGARFALRDSTVGAAQVAPAIGIQLDQGVMRFTLSGYVTLLQNTTRFIGLRFGTDGQFALQGASFLSRPIDVIPNYARFVSANITNSALELRGDVKLPAPFTQQAPQQLMVRITPDGQVTGGGKVVIISEPAGLATARTKLSIGVAAFHLRHLDLAIDLGDANNTAVSVVVDAYIQEKQSNLLRFGSVNGGTVVPGLRVAVTGDVTWGGIAMPQPIALEMGPVNLNFTSVTSTTTNTGFALSISGSIGLKLAGAGGSLAFQNVGFNSDGQVRIGSAQFNGGTFTIQNTVSIVVGRIAWSDSTRDIWLPIARPPSSNGEITQDSVLTTVSSFVDLGASIDVAGVFSGGVDRVLVYVAQADATTHFLVENLHVQIPGVIEFHANMSYDQLVDGFDLALSTQGLLMSAYRIGLVGVMGKRGDVFRAGLFLRTSLTVPIIPGIVTLTEVGGGLFVNPKPSDLQMVKSVAGMSGPSANRVGMPPAGAFAVMLYAGFEVAGSNGVSAAAGRALVTITDQAFQINATAAFFRMNDKIQGDLALQVGWTPAVYVRGDVSLIISVPKTVQGTASVQFFAGSNIFAIKGNLDLVVIETVNAFAEVIIVPSGFTANLGFAVEKKTNVVGVKLAANLRIWYRPSTSDLGAYLKLVGQVTAFGVTGEIGLIGALVIQPELAIYAQGTARIVGVDVLRVDVWVQYTSAGVAAGVGRNAELEAVIANAEQIAADLEAEADRILAGIDAAAIERARTPIPVSDASLNAAYQNFQRWNVWQMLVLWGGFRADESRLRGGLLPLNATDPYVAFYEGAIGSTAAAADTAIVRQLREEATQKLAVINDRKAEIEQRIRGLRLELDAAEAAAEFLPPADPVTQWDAGTPTFVPGSTTLDGKPVMTVANAPAFELDDQLSATARAAMTAAAAQNAARAERLRSQIATVEEGLSTVIAATSASDPASFASYARLHNDAVDAIEHMHAANVDFRMRRRTWAQAKLDTLAAQRTALVQRLNDKLRDITVFQNANSTVEFARLRGTATELDSLARNRARFLSAWATDPSILADYEADAVSRRASVTENAKRLNNDPNDGGARAQINLAITFFQSKAVDYGVLDWWGVVNTGLTTSRDGAQALVDEANTTAVPVIRAMRDMHARITSDLASLNARQADLYGVLFDLYDGYLRTYGATDSVGQRFTSRKAEIAVLLQAPQVSSPSVTVTDFGYLSSINTTWSGAHPRGVYEYLIQDGDDSLFTVGAQGQVRRWMYTTNAAGGSNPRNQVVSVRGGAGFTGSASTPYTVTFMRGSATNPSTQVAVPPVDVTAPGTPVVTIVDLPTLPNALGEQQFWTSDSSRLAVRWTATDAESGIAEYEYRVVTYPIPQQSTGTVTLGGSLTLLTPTPLTSWASAGGRTSMTIQGLVLPVGRHIHVEVRAKNGAGLVGSEGSSAVVRYDATRPVFAAGATIAPQVVGKVRGSTGSFAIPGYTPPLLPACGYISTLRGAVSPKVWDGKLVTVTPNNAVVGGASPVQMAFSRPTAADPETGIGAYLYRVDSVPPSTTLPTTGWRDILETGATFTATGPDFVYGKPRYVTLVAVNQAGRMSAPLTHGPITVADATDPTAPNFCGDFAGGGFIAYMTAPSVDPETGIRGYQMRMRGPTGAVVRDFPPGTIAGVTLDWPASQATAGSGFRLPIIPAIGGLHTVDLRAVSGLGVAGPIASSGTMLVDNTPPPVAGVTGSMTSTTVNLTLTLSNDPESGLAGVDVAFGNTPSDPTLNPKSTGVILVPYTTYAAAAGTGTLRITLPASVAATSPIHVYVRVRNGAGIVSTVSSARVK